MEPTGNSVQVSFNQEIYVVNLDNQIDTIICQIHKGILGRQTFLGGILLMEQK